MIAFIKHSLNMTLSKKIVLNSLIIIKALAVSLWFFATGKLFGIMMPNVTMRTVLFTMALSVLILVLDDGYLTELHKLKDTTVAAAMSMIGGQDDKNVKII